MASEGLTRLFVDMDGTLAVFQHVDSPEALYREGYFRDLPPIPSVVDAVRDLAADPNVNVHILSAVLPDSPYALAEKNQWLDTYLPEIPRDHRIFPPCGQNKGDYIDGGVNSWDYLLDDYTHNLNQWEGTGIKLLNGINYTHGTWQGDRVSWQQPGETLAEKILAVTRCRHVRDELPQRLIWELDGQLLRTTEPGIPPENLYRQLYDDLQR